MDKQRKQPPTISRCDQVRAMQRQGGDKITAIMVSHESEPSKHQFIDGGYSSGHACKIFNCGLPASAEAHAVVGRAPLPELEDDLRAALVEELESTANLFASPHGWIIDAIIRVLARRALITPLPPTRSRVRRN